MAGTGSADIRVLKRNYGAAKYQFNEQWMLFDLKIADPLRRLTRTPISLTDPEFVISKDTAHIGNAEIIAAALSHFKTTNPEAFSRTFSGDARTTVDNFIDAYINLVGTFTSYRAATAARDTRDTEPVAATTTSNPFWNHADRGEGEISAPVAATGFAACCPVM